MVNFRDESGPNDFKTVHSKPYTWWIKDMEAIITWLFSHKSMLLLKTKSHPQAHSRHHHCASTSQCSTAAVRSKNWPNWNPKKTETPLHSLPQPSKRAFLLSRNQNGSMLQWSSTMHGTNSNRRKSGKQKYLEQGEGKIAPFSMSKYQSDNVHIYNSYWNKFEEIKFTFLFCLLLQCLWSVKVVEGYTMVKSNMRIVTLDQANDPYRTPCLHSTDIKFNLNLES